MPRNTLKYKNVFYTYENEREKKNNVSDEQDYRIGVEMKCVLWHYKGGGRRV